MLNLKRQNGFTLVELMVVVAIIGILSSVAIPQFQTYQAKSRTSEAKLNLAGIYSAEIAFQGETAFYGTCLEVMGFRLVGPTNTRYYNIGFDTAQPSDNTDGIITTVLNCDTASAAATVGLAFYSGSKGGNTAGDPEIGTAPAITIGGSVAADTAEVTDSGFRAAASGRVSSSNTTDSDVWSIDHNKAIVHISTGY